MDKNAIIINNLETMQDNIYDRYNVTCRQYGAKYMAMLLELAKDIVGVYDPDELTQDIQDALTDNNCHLCSIAIDVIKNFSKYAGYQYI